MRVFCVFRNQRVLVRADCRGPNEPTFRSAGLVPHAGGWEDRRVGWWGEGFFLFGSLGVWSPQGCCAGVGKKLAGIVEDDSYCSARG